MAKAQAAPNKRKAKTPAKTGNAKKPAKQNPAGEKGFPIVGIGASAGGLEALEQFFTHMPADSGMAFVIVQHLYAGQHSSMPEIMTRFSKMPTRVATDGLKVEPDSIYLIPPTKNMEIKNGSLFLHEAAPPPELRLPVDFFFRSLAEEKRQDAIGVILSGTGSDGTLGLRAIKQELGTIFVQDPMAAKYDGMPRSAIDTGLADFVLKSDEMPEKMIQFVRHSALNSPVTDTDAAETQRPMQQIFAILRTSTGHDFSGYRQSTVRRRLQRRMSFHQTSDMRVYVNLLKKNEDEVKALLKDLLISVTSFFRDTEAFEILKEQLKELIKSKADADDLRAWIAGCATGEEAYSVAIIISECLNELEKHLKVQIYGTDIDVEALQAARTGKYPSNISTDVTPERLKRYFIKDGSFYLIRKEIREMVVFAPQNFIKDPPFSKMDLICCRNVLIYLESDVQKRTIPLLHYALKPGGVLLLGPSESIGEASDLFHQLSRKWKLYQRRETLVSAVRLRFPTSFSPVPIGRMVQLPTEPDKTRIPEMTERIFLDNYAPTFAVIDEKFRLVYVRGRTGKYLEIASGQPSLSILDMAREGLRTELASLVHRAVSEKKPVTHEGIRIKYNGGFQVISLTVAPITEPEVPPGLTMIIFRETATTSEETRRGAGRQGRGRISLLQEELLLNKERLQTIIEENETTNEELKSANEELQSNNEELQSTNEELDTSREEMQSLNEELTTLNSELQDKNNQVVKANDDLRNFLNRTDIAILFLDDELKIRSYTPATAEVFNIRDIDIGRPLSEITSRVTYEDLDHDAREVLRTVQVKEKEVSRSDGKSYKLRIMPYLTAQNVMNGVVISFSDISQQVQELGFKDEFIGMVSHELRTPLTVIIGALNTAIDKRISNEEKDEMLRDAASNSELLASILDNLLELSRYRAGRLNLEKNWIKISDIANRVQQRIHRVYDRNNIVMDIPESTPEINADAIKVEQVLYNLIENAVKYSPEDCEIRVFVRNEPKELSVGVSDHGPGIELEDQKRIFEPFHRPRGNSKGVGLGLNVCRRLVEAHGGRIWVESIPGAGSTFYFSIPKSG